MELGTWWMTGGMALFATAVSVGGRRKSALAQVGGAAFAVLLWFVWARAAFAVVEVTNTGTEVVHHHPQLGYIGLFVALVMAADLMVAVIDLAERDEPLQVLFS